MKWLLLSILIILAGCSNPLLRNPSDVIVIDDATCSDNSDCSSQWCIADLSPEQMRAVTDGIVIKTMGKCRERSNGCYAGVNNGQVDNILCVDE